VKPFGAIDTPTQGGNASGSSFINWGWVLTPQPNKIPTDGSTINVYVDGVNLGHPTYNIYRSDIASLFPGYANSNGAAGYFYLDTTAYENGVHTIQWTASDDTGNKDGIGSRYFTIQNTGGSAARTAQSAGRTAQSAECRTSPAGIRVKKGYSEEAEPREIYPDEHDMITIEIKELERLEIHIPEGTRGLAPLSRYTGYHVVGPQLRPLPIGSYLDTEKGIFYWQPGVGYLGEYRFVFIKRGDAGGMNKMFIRVKIIPKF
jgi:hypothetical protein